MPDVVHFTLVPTVTTDNIKFPEIEIISDLHDFASPPGFRFHYFSKFTLPDPCMTATIVTYSISTPSLTTSLDVQIDKLRIAINPELYQEG